MKEKKFIFRFTLKLNGKIEEHFVESSNIELAKNYLAQRLDIDESIIRHNNKNLSFNVRKDLNENPQNYNLHKDTRAVTKDATSNPGINMEVDYLKTARYKIDEILSSNDDEQIQAMFSALTTMVKNEKLQNELFKVNTDKEGNTYEITIDDMCNYISMTKHIQ